MKQEKAVWEEGQEEREAEEKARGGTEGGRTSRRGREVKRHAWEQWSKWDVGRKRYKKAPQTNGGRGRYKEGVVESQGGREEGQRLCRGFIAGSSS